MKGTAAEREKYLFQAFIGPNGSGKTYLAMMIANATSNRQVRIRCNHRDMTLTKGAVIVETKAALVRQMKKPGHNIICFDGARIYGDEMAFKVVAMLCMNVGGWLILADEAHRYMGNKHVKPSGFLVPLLGQHYHARIHFLWTAFRLVDVHPDWRTQTWQKHHFYSPNNTDKKTLSGDVGGAIVTGLKARNQERRYSYVLEDRIKDAVIMPPWPAKKPYTMGRAKKP